MLLYFSSRQRDEAEKKREKDTLMLKKPGKETRERKAEIGKIVYQAKGPLPSSHHC